jgi:hypothetical protein
MAKFYQGRFNPRNPGKYNGDPLNIIYRSSWELKAMMVFDQHPGIIKWSSEEIVIPYISPVDNRPHRYFVDFYIKKKDQYNTIEELLIEIKPLSQTKPPETKTKKTKKYINEVITYAINQAKWEACNKYCKERNMKFLIFTEKDLFDESNKNL